MTHDIWFTSDTHFGHENIIKYADRPHHAFQYRKGIKGYANVGEMNEDIVERANARVKRGDILYHLGDVGMGNYEGWASCVKSINGFKKLTFGNHDPSITKLLKAGFHTVCEQDYLIVDGLSFWLSHIPEYDSDGYTRAAHLKRPVAAQPYDVILCGHVHNLWQVSSLGEINVGVDQWEMAPVHIDELVAMAKKLKGNS